MPQSMDHYVDIHLLPDPEFSAPELMNALFAKVHRALALSRYNDIGISFPETAAARRDLGGSLRLHGAKAVLQHLMANEWLAGMRDHVGLSGVNPVPSWATQQYVRRIQAKSNPDRLRRRQMKRKGWTAEQAREAIPDDVAETLDLPYLTVRSQSTAQTFRLFVRHQPTQDERTGTFNSYGFSNDASLPKF